MQQWPPDCAGARCGIGAPPSSQCFSPLKLMKREGSRTGLLTRLEKCPVDLEGDWLRDLWGAMSGLYGGGALSWSVSVCMFCSALCRTSTTLSPCREPRARACWGKGRSFSCSRCGSWKHRRLEDLL